jgi:hypothetical protein
MQNEVDPERHAFLAQLEGPLRARFPHGTFSYGPVAPFPCLALRVDLGDEGAIEVVPVSLSGNAMGYSGRPFPGNGEAHWLVRRVGPHGESRGRVFTCQRVQVEAALEAWTAPPLPVPELVVPPKRREELVALAKAKRPAFAEPSPGPAFAEHVRPRLEREPHLTELVADLAELAPERIAYFFPFGPTGARKARVILGTYGPFFGSRSHCLYVTAKRNVLELGLDQLIVGNQPHVWTSLRWRWDRRVPVPAPEERWGLPVGDDLPGRWLALMDEGRFAEAFALYAIEADDQLVRKVAGQRPAGSLSPHIEEWAEELRAVLWSLAPWKLAAELAVNRGAQLHLLSHQQGLHKSFLSVLRQQDGFRLYLESSTQNGVFPEHRFKRDVEQDLARFGLAPPNIPGPSSLAAPDTQTKKARPNASGKAEARARMLQAKWEEKLVELFRDASGHVDHAVVHARRRDTGVVLPIVLRELRSPQPKVRAYVILVAGRLSLPVGDEAIACLGDANVSVVQAGMDTLCRLRHAPGLEATADCMYERPEVRYNGAWTVRSWGARPTEALTAHLSSNHEKLRAAAAIAIGVYKSRAHPKPLLEHLASDTPLVAGAALRALELLQVPEAKIAERLAARADVDAVRSARDHWAELKTIG